MTTTILPGWSLDEHGQKTSLKAGEVYTIDGTVVKAGDIWLIDGI